MLDARRLVVELLLLALTAVVAGVEALQAFRSGLRAHFRSAWNWFDLLKVLALFAMLAQWSAIVIVAELELARLVDAVPALGAGRPATRLLVRARCRHFLEE